MQQSLSPARRNHSLPPCVDAIDEALPIGSGTYRQRWQEYSPPGARAGSANGGKKKGASKGAFLFLDCVISRGGR